jgi:hypothetical protein
MPYSDGHLVGAFAYLRDLILYAELADGIGQTAIAQSVARRLVALKNEFNSAFFNSQKNVYGSGLQTENAMGLWLEAVPSNNLPQVLNNLVRDIVVTNNKHITTGILGWKFLLETLSDHNLGDIGVLINLQTTYPSIGYMIEGEGNMEPATTVWELWDSDKEGPGMNSRNHIMFGSVGSWFYKSFLGIYPSPIDRNRGTKTGFGHFRVGPDARIVNVNNSTSASGRVTTPLGALQIRWALEPDSACEELPEGATVTFTCPGSTIQGIVSAFYGTPLGTCITGFSKGQCNAADAAAIVSKECVGKGMCSFVVSNDFFGGDPCFGTAKQFAGAISCADDVSQPKYFLNVIVPPGASADILIPVISSFNQTAQSIVITESQGLVYNAQKYVPGVPGISGARVNMMGNGIIIQASSGNYTFHSRGN